MTEEEIVKRLTWIANAKIGDPIPEWLPANDWVSSLSQLAKETLNLIKYQNEIIKMWSSRSPN